MELPERLRDAIEAELNIQSSKQLAKLTADLSQLIGGPVDGRTFIRFKPMLSLCCFQNAGYFRRSGRF